MAEYFIIEAHAVDSVSAVITEDTVCQVVVEDRDVQGEVLRIEEKIGRDWSGVRSCGDADRIGNELDAAMRAWAGAQLLDHPDHKLVRWGHGAGAAWHSNSGGDGWPRSPRRCRGALQVPAYIVFMRPA